MKRKRWIKGKPEHYRKRTRPARDFRRYTDKARRQGRRDVVAFVVVSVVAVAAATILGLCAGGVLGVGDRVEVLERRVVELSETVIVLSDVVVAIEAVE